jgi:hypothetical protein
MHRSLRLLALVLLIVAPATPQTRRAAKPTKSPAPLNAREIAKHTLPSVVVLVTEDAHGKALMLGSGFQVGLGIIATNYHVIRDASRAYASFHGGNPKFEILGTLAVDEENDLALLRLGRVIAQEDAYDEIVATALALPLARVRSAEIGDTVYVVGNPEGLEGTFSQGIISALRGNDYIQITAPISPGSSGGPVVNQYGEVIGIATSFNKEGQNLNFAIPVAKLGVLMRNLSTVTPLAPHIRLRFDGMYWTSWKGDDGSDYVDYLRFYENGSVFKVGTTPEVSLNEVFTWLPSTTNPVLYSGKYVIRTSDIQFTLSPRILARGIDASIDYEGIVEGSTIRLQSYNHWTALKEMRDYRFVKIVH